jgi:hypothetical protein
VSNSVGSDTLTEPNLIRVDEPPCNALTGVTITGPSRGVMGVNFTFTASVSPPDADHPIAFNWEPTPSSGQGTAEITHNWSTTGTKTITVTVSNCEATATATDALAIQIDTPASSEGIVIDNLDPEFTTTGVWHESSADGEYEGSSLYASDDDNAPGSATATWVPYLTQEGEYLVSAWWALWPTRAQHAPYSIYHAYGSKTVRVNQSENGGQWILLGTFPFRDGTGGYVTLTREVGDGSSTSADAIKFIRIGELPPVRIYLPVITMYE